MIGGQEKATPQATNSGRRVFYSDRGSFLVGNYLRSSQAVTDGNKIMIDGSVVRLQGIQTFQKGIKTSHNSIIIDRTLGVARTLTAISTDSVEQALTELTASAIDESLIGVAVEVALDLEIDPITREAIATPLDDALGKSYTRFGWQAHANEAGLIFRNEDGTTWQVKRGIGLANNNGRSGRYLAPGGIGNAIYLPPISDQVLAKICDRHDLDLATVQAEIAAIGSFWDWFQSHPELPIIVTEGGKKSLAALSAGRIAIALYGCTCGRSESLKPFLADRTVIAALDQDDKPTARKAVAMGLFILASSVKDAGGKLSIARWFPHQGKGIDDLIAQSGVEAFDMAIDDRQAFAAWSADRAVANPLGNYKPDLKVCVPCLSAVHPESIPESGIVAIIGGTGTGKTKLLSALQKTTLSVLALGHRTSLQRGLSERLGLTYIKDADRGNGYLMDANGNPTTNIGLCFDSLLGISIWLYPDGSYDLFLDETDQGLKHLVSGGTCGKDGKRPALVARAIALIKGARRVILASATLTRHELDFVVQVRGETPWILENTYTANSYPIELFSGQAGEKGSLSKARATVTARIIAAIKQGKRIIVATDTLRNSKAIALVGESLGLSPHQILRFDRDTSAEDLQRAFADRPDEFLDRHDIRLMVHSPSLTSGVSIEGDHFDYVFGLFEGQTITPDDVLQALARVRKPIPRIVYVSHYGKGNATIDATRKADYLEQSQRRAAMIGKVSGVAIETRLDDPIDEYHAATQAARNAAMITFGASVQALLARAGHHVTIGTPDPNADTKQWRDTIQATVEADRYALATAPIIDALQASDLRAKKSLKHEDALKLSRYDLCDWYLIEQAALSIADVEFDKNGRSRREISRTEGLNYDGLSRSKDMAQFEQLRSHNAPIQNHDLPGRELESEAAKRLGVDSMIADAIESDGWHAGTPWVKRFAATAREFALDSKLALGFRVHENMTDCAIVGTVLRNFGFRTTSRNLGTDGHRCRVYRIDQDSLDKLKQTMQRRHKRHIEKGFTPRSHRLTKLLLTPLNVDPNEALNTLQISEKTQKTELRPPTIPD